MANKQQSAAQRREKQRQQRAQRLQGRVSAAAISHIALLFYRHKVYILAGIE